MSEKLQVYIYVVLVLFVTGVSFGSRSVLFGDIQPWLSVARYTFYLLIIKNSHAICYFGYQIIHTKRLVWPSPDKRYLIFTASIAVLVYYEQSLLGPDFLLLFIGYLITKYPEMEKQCATISYGVGMACSFYEGYLAHIIPSDGSRFVGFEENINIYEAKQGVVFPVKRLFIIITKSLYCPPDLKHFNKKNRPDLSYLEACQSLEDVEKDVAGVKNRTYRNSAYKICRPARPAVFAAAECATPLHTLHRVLEKRALYTELANVKVDEIVSDFCGMLRSIIAKNPESRDKCELVFYDDTDPTLNLADILLDKIQELEPNYEKIRRD